ncbi:MAG: 16S rRNA (uracil(1498)-N(3))-methyltransferase [Actinomyces bowdenii]|nr:16S rRNA (uracil(1498)-N(3))-methyltransferase [Actinomyces bowdenii]
MSAPVFILTPQTTTPAVGQATAPGAELVLTGPEARHALTVRRLRAGEPVDLVDGAGLRLRCLVTSPGAGAKDRLGVRVVERVEEPAPPVALTLIQALAKGGRDEQAVETATEVGVGSVVPWQASRCVSLWQGPKRDKGRQRWQNTAREAAKQARRAVIPTVEAPHSTAELAARVRRCVADGGVVAVLHEEATVPLASLPAPAPHDEPGAPRPVLAVVVGPEGGITDEEIAALEQAGAVTVRLGPHIMRTASAGPVALAVLAQRQGLWG